MFFSTDLKDHLSQKDGKFKQKKKNSVKILNMNEDIKNTEEFK